MSKSNDTQTPTKPATVWGITSREFYASVQNQVVTITSMDGKLYTLTLVGVDQYDLVCRQKDGPLILMPKHAVKLIVPGNGKSE